MKKYIPLFEEFLVSQDGKLQSNDSEKYPHIKKFIDGIWDGSVDANEIILKMGHRENLKEVLWKADQMFKDLQAKGINYLPFPDDPEYQDYINHEYYPEYEIFRKAMRNVDDIE